MISKRYLSPLLLGLLAAFGPACAAETPEPTDSPAENLGETSEAIITASADKATVTDIPFYFSVPKHSLAGTLEEERKSYPYKTVWNVNKQKMSGDLGLRMIVVKDNGVAARREMAANLGKAGVLQDGDIVLSFRTFLAETMGYPHIQMGSTHAGLTFLDTDKGTAHNVDQPMDGDYNRVENNKRFVGSFDAKHYAGAADSTDALHILRPRWSAEDRPRRTANLRAWIAQLGKTHESIRAAGGLNFNSDYLKPLLTQPQLGSASKIATQFGKIMLGAPAPKSFDMFCSEMAYYLLALSNCTIDNIQSEKGDEATCAQTGLPFVPMKILGDPGGPPGLAEGPMLGLLGVGANPKDKAGIESVLGQIFPTVPGANGSKLSAGHRAVAEATKPLMAGVQGYYAATFAGQTEQAKQAALGVNAATQNVTNYSPTAFLVNALLPNESPFRTVDYVATVLFADDATVKRAGELAKPGPVVP